MPGCFSCVLSTMLCLLDHNNCVFSARLLQRCALLCYVYLITTAVCSLPGCFSTVFSTLLCLCTRLLQLCILDQISRVFSARLLQRCALLCYVYLITTAVCSLPGCFSTVFSTLLCLCTKLLQLCILDQISCVFSARLLQRCPLLCYVSLPCCRLPVL